MDSKEEIENINYCIDQLKSPAMKEYIRELQSVTKSAMEELLRQGMELTAAQKRIGELEGELKELKEKAQPYFDSLEHGDWPGRGSNVNF